MKKKIKITYKSVSDVMNFVCPNCNTDFTEEDLIDLCGAPFNGIVVICKNCKKEFSANILIELEEKK